jgi:fermentation-respiration switch protein FrsA (DUF1100 family)
MMNMRLTTSWCKPCISSRTKSLRSDAQWEVVQRPTSSRPVAGLVLESAFSSAFRVMTRVLVLPFDRFNNLQKIKKIHCPVMIIHGTEDSVIKIAHGRRLFAAANEPKQALWVEGAKHNDVAFVGGTRYFNSLKAFAMLIQHYQLEAGSRGP